MNSECESCGLPVRIVQVIGQSDLDEWYCTNPDCASFGFDQAPRLRGQNYVEQSMLADGSILIRQNGKESQGESNLDAVGKMLAASWRQGYMWKKANPNGHAQEEQGIDGYLVDADENRIAVQITRMVDRAFCEKLAASTDNRATQRLSRSGLPARIMRAVNQKSRKTPNDSRRQCVLAIDALQYDFMLWLSTDAMPSYWRQRVSRWAGRKGWREFVIVGSGKTWFLCHQSDCMNSAIPPASP